MDANQSVNLAREWVEDFVIKQNLCPFAGKPAKEGRVRFSPVEYKGLEENLHRFWTEIKCLERADASEISNTLLIFIHGPEAFEDYLLLFELCEELLEMQGRTSKFQLASFHPEYQFEGIETDDPRNFTNRSPLPMIHILRTEEVEKAIEFHPDTLQIPAANEEKLKNIGLKNLKDYLSLLIRKWQNSPPS